MQKIHCTRTTAKTEKTKKNKNEKKATQHNELPAVMASLRFLCALSSGWKSNKAANIAAKAKKKNPSKIITTTAKAENTVVLVKPSSIKSKELQKIKSIFSHLYTAATSERRAEQTNCG